MLFSASTPGSTHPYLLIRSNNQLAAGNRSYPARSVIVRYTSRRPSRVPSTDNARHTSSYDDRSTGLLANVSVTSGAVTDPRSLSSRRNHASTNPTTVTGAAYRNTSVIEDAYASNASGRSPLGNSAIPRGSASSPSSETP